MIFIEDAEMGFKSAIVAFRSLVFSTLAAEVPLRELYIEPAAPISVCMFDRM